MRSNAGALLVLVGLSCAARWCEESAATPPPAVAWDGKAYVAAWRDGSSIYVQRGAPRRVARGASSESEPTIAAVPDGFVVVTNRQGRTAAWQQVVIPLDSQARPKRPVAGSELFSADRQCRVSHASGEEAVAIGFLGRIEDSFWLDISAVDRLGNVLQSWMFFASADLVECVLASRDRVVAMVTRKGGTKLSLNFLDVGGEASWVRSFDVSASGDWHVSLVPLSGSAWAMLYRDRSDRLVVATFNRARVIEPFEVPFETNQTADLGVTTRGLFVAWLDGRTLHVRGIASGQDHQVRVPKGAGIQATGHDDECAVAVRPPGGDHVTIERLPRCI